MLQPRQSIFVIGLTVVLCVLILPGCVRRTLKITTEPAQAHVYLNDLDVGRSAVERDFLWYGDYDVVIRKEGYETLKTNWVIPAPWYQWVPFDFFFEVLWPGEIHDVHEAHFALAKRVDPEPDELIERAGTARERALTADEESATSSRDTGGS